MLDLVIAGFVLQPVLGFAPSIVALLVARVLVAISAADTDEVLSKVGWPTSAFFAGLFVMIGGLAPASPEHVPQPISDAGRDAAVPRS